MLRVCAFKLKNLSKLLRIQSSTSDMVVFAWPANFARRQLARLIICQRGREKGCRAGCARVPPHAQLPSIHGQFCKRAAQVESDSCLINLSRLHLSSARLLDGGKSTVKLPPRGVLSVKASVAVRGRIMKLSKAKERERERFYSVSDVLEGRELLRLKLALSAKHRSISPRNGIALLKMDPFWLVRTCLCSRQCGLSAPLCPLCAGAGASV